ncbi:hypothetical protein Tco_1534917, partial [Tanacetum coccineum]
PIDEDNLQELFGPDQRERLTGKQQAKKKQKSDYRRKCDAAEEAYKAKKEKELDVAMGKIDSFSGSRLNKVLHGVLQFTLWSIWKWRNRITHADLDVAAKIKEEDIFPGIQRVSKNWISARLKACTPNWDVWISRPFDLFSV